MSLVVTMIGLAGALSGCRSSTGTVRENSPTPPLEQGVELLNRPLPGPMAALYQMEVPSSGGFRFSIAAVEGGNGRMTVSEPFGAAVILAGWDAEEAEQVFDLREGCRLLSGAVPVGFGLEGLPLRRIFRVLGGRLPVLRGEAVEVVDDQVVEVSTDRGVVRATLDRDPWRIVKVEGIGFSVTLDQHSSSLPGRIRFRSDSGDKAELELVRLQWQHTGGWAPLPDLPPCVGQ